MKSIVTIVLLIINLISFAVLFLCSAVLITAEFTGVPEVEKMLKKIHIYITYDQFVKIGFIAMTIVIISFILRAKLSGKM